MEKTYFKYEGHDVSLYVHSNIEDYVSMMIKYFQKFYESDFLTFLKYNFNMPQKNIIDIGANIGNHSLFFSKFMDCDRVYSFEPFPKNIELFKKNLQDYKKCILYDIALSDTNSRMPLYNSEKDNYGGFSLHKQEKSFLINESVPTLQLDYYNFTNIGLIKIDVENHETQVLRGGRNTILRNKPVICLENNSYLYNMDVSSTKEVMKELGYKILHERICIDSSMDIWVPV